VAPRETTALSKQVGLHGRWNRAAGDDRRLGLKGRENDMADAIERNAETQNLYREVNERVAEVYSQLGGVTGDRMSELIELFCECGQQAPCEERVNITAATYERVRADPTTFILLPGHGIAIVEDVIERGDGFLIARNIGRAADIARAADPRRDVVDPGSPPAAA
jgi:hypothetical protein